jgi:hypothetical protein
LQPIDTTSVGANPQGLLLFDDHLFVCNSGYGQDRTVSVINVISGAVDTTLTVRDQPIIVAGWKIWVSCKGYEFGARNIEAVYDQPLTSALEDSIFFQNLLGSIAAGTDGSILSSGFLLAALWWSRYRITAATLSLSQFHSELFTRRRLTR